MLTLGKKNGTIEFLSMRGFFLDNKKHMSIRGSHLFSFCAQFNFGVLLPDAGRLVILINIII